MLRKKTEAMLHAVACGVTQGTEQDAKGTKVEAYTTVVLSMQHCT